MLCFRRRLWLSVCVRVCVRDHTRIDDILHIACGNLTKFTIQVQLRDTDELIKFRGQKVKGQIWSKSLVQKCTFPAKAA